MNARNIHKTVSAAAQRCARVTVSICGRFLRSTRAATAVEFGMVAAPFIALLIAILELAVVQIAQQVLQTATNQAARLIMTGQAQNEGMTSTQFQQQVCNNATPLFTCANLYVNVQTFSTFSSVSMTNPDNGGTFSPGSLGYSPGGDGDIVVVQSFYQWPVVLGPLGFNLSNMSGNKLLLVATAAFRNEPY
jgi:Flp pilus assembly protein TadG